MTVWFLLSPGLHGFWELIFDFNWEIKNNICGWQVRVVVNDVNFCRLCFARNYLKAIFLDASWTRFKMHLKNLIMSYFFVLQPTHVWLLRWPWTWANKVHKRTRSNSSKQKFLLHLLNIFISNPLNTKKTFNPINLQSRFCWYI